jgi:hypothetical protein
VSLSYLRPSLNVTFFVTYSQLSSEELVISHSVFSHVILHICLLLYLQLVLQYIIYLVIFLDICHELPEGRQKVWVISLQWHLRFYIVWPLPHHLKAITFSPHSSYSFCTFQITYKLVGKPFLTFLLTN